MKKAAMFGFGARIKKCCHPELDSGSNNLSTKTGAMFGLDARIALAIFGALSVISGAALYSAIQQSQVIAVINDIQEINKAVESYMLDVGADVPMSSSFARVKIEDLVVDPGNVANWNGPYLPYLVNVEHILNHTKYVDIQVFNRSINDAWAGKAGVDDVLPSCLEAAKPCAYWSTIGGLPTTLAEKIDEYIDGTLDYKNGKARIYSYGPDLDVAYIYIMGPIRLSQ